MRWYYSRFHDCHLAFRCRQLCALNISQTISWVLVLWCHSNGLAKTCLSPINFRFMSKLVGTAQSTEWSIFSWTFYYRQLAMKRHSIHHEIWMIKLHVLTTCFTVNNWCRRSFVILNSDRLRQEIPFYTLWLRYLLLSVVKQQFLWSCLPGLHLSAIDRRIMQESGMHHNWHEVEVR